MRAILAVRREAAYWRRTVGADTPRAYWTYLHTYPKGPHIPDARRRLAMLSAEFEPPPDFRPEAFADLPPPPPDELVYDDRPIYAFDDFGPPPPPPPVQYVYVEDDDWRDLPPPPPPAEIGLLPVLGVALPIAIGAVAYQHGFHHDGIAPRGEPRLRPPPFAPPPLPANIKPVAPPAPVAVAAAPAANAAVVKPLRPIGRSGQPGGRPGGPGKPGGPPPSGARRAGKPGRRCGPCRPGSRRWPSAQAASDPASGGHSARRRPPGRRAKAPRQRRAASDRCEACRSRRSRRKAVADSSCRRRCAQRATRSWRQAAARGPRPKRSGSNRRAGATKPAGKVPLPLPAPPAAVAAPNAPAVPGGKPLPVVPSPNAAAPAAAPVATKPAGKAPAPAAGAAVAPGGKPLTPTAVTDGNQAAHRSSSVSCSGSEAAAASASKQPSAEAQCRSQPPVVAPRAPAPPPAVHAPAPAALAPSAPRPAPAAMRVPAAPVAAAPPAPHLAPPGGSRAPAPRPRRRSFTLPRRLRPRRRSFTLPRRQQRLAACASSAAARCSSPAAGRATSSVREAWVAALSEVALAPLVLPTLCGAAGGFARSARAMRRVSDGNEHPICRWRSFADGAGRQSRQGPAFGGCGGKREHKSGRGSPALLADDDSRIDPRSARSGRRFRIGAAGERHHLARCLRGVGERRALHRASVAPERILSGRRPYPSCSAGGDSARGRGSAGRAVARYDCRYRRRRACPK